MKPGFKVLIAAIITLTLGMVVGYWCIKPDPEQQRALENEQVVYYKKLNIIAELKLDLDMYNFCIKQKNVLQASEKTTQNIFETTNLKLTCSQFALNIDKTLLVTRVLFKLEARELQLIQKILDRPDLKVLNKVSQLQIQQVYEILANRMAKQVTNQKSYK